MMDEKIELPKQVREFLEGMFFNWDFPPSWCKINTKLEGDILEVSFSFGDKSTCLYFLSDDKKTWFLEVGEDCDEIEITSIHAENHAFWMFIGHMGIKKPKQK